MSYTRLSPLKPGQEAAFARLLQAKMDETGVTLDDISEATGVTKPSVYRWANGYNRPGGTRIVAMAAPGSSQWRSFSSANPKS